jgi:beta-lactamase class A
MDMKRMVPVLGLMLTLIMTPLKAFAAPDVPFVPNPAPAALDPGLADVIQRALPSNGGTFGIAVQNLTTGQTALLNADAFFPTASLYKTGVMYEFYRQKKAGRLSVDDMLTEQPYDYDDEGTNLVGLPGSRIAAGTALQLMMTVSDNVAANMLEDHVGRANVNTAFDGLGLHSTRVHTWAAGDPVAPNASAYTTASDMLKLYAGLAGGAEVDAGSNREMLNLLLANQVADRLPALLPDGTPVAHKNGELDGLINDAGIVYGPKSTYVVVVLDNHVPNLLATPQLHGPGAEVGTANMARLSKAIYQYFES